MPKVAPTKAVPKETLLVLKHGTRKVLVPRPKTYAALLEAAIKNFSRVSKTTVVLETNEIDVCRGEFVEITPESWDLLSGHTFSVVVRESPQLCGPSLVAPHSNHGPKLGDTALPITAPGDKPLSIKLHVIPGGETRSIRVYRGTSCSKLMRVLKSSIDRDLSFCYDGERLSPFKSVQDYGMEDGDEIVGFEKQYGGKPVIYLFSPSEIDAAVTLSLVPDWSFSAIYPVVPIKPLFRDLGEQIQWNVRIHQDGSLTEVNTGLEMTYLFWEAHTNTSILPPNSPPPSPVRGQSSMQEYFSPSSSDLSDSDSVLLAIGDVTNYLDQVLRVLGLHTEARTSFITYWLPSFLKHSHIALRFLPQSAYERAAPLEIVPKPDIVTRIFMLFKGIVDEELPNWQNAQTRGTTCDAHGSAVAWWKDIVGVDLDRALDGRLYRVLEWGGMEVLRP